MKVWLLSDSDSDYQTIRYIGLSFKEIEDWAYQYLYRNGYTDIKTSKIYHDTTNDCMAACIQAKYHGHPAQLGLTMNELEISKPLSVSLS